MATIFAGGKSNAKDNPDPRVSLLFLENDADLDRWFKIEDKFLKHDLLADGTGPNSKAKRKPFVALDLKPLYGLRPEDVNYLAGQVEAGIVFMKSSKVMKDKWGKPLISIQEAGAREKKIRAMKNELMTKYLGYHLLSKRPEYQPYTAESFDEFTEENRITRVELELWVDKSLAMEAEAKWLNGRTKAFNKTFDAADYPEAVRGMWKRFLSSHAEETMETVNLLEFENEFCCKVLDSRTWDVSSILADSSVKSWRREGKMHMYFWFLFRITGAGVEPMRLESHKLKRVFDALEYRSASARVVHAQSPAVLITDAIGFYDVLSHLKRRHEEVKVRFWDYHVINYIPNAADGFPKPALTGSRL